MWTEITRRKYEREGQRYASDVTDAEWALIEPHMPAVKRLGLCGDDYDGQDPVQACWFHGRGPQPIEQRGKDVHRNACLSQSLG